jgi:hypothetical protein
MREGGKEGGKEEGRNGRTFLRFFFMQFLIVVINMLAG